MHVVWRGRSAFRTVIDDEISGQGRSKVQHISELVRDALQAVLSVSDREVMIHDWKRIAVDSEVLIKLHTLLFRRQIYRAQEAEAFRNRLPVDSRSCTANTMRNVTEEYVEPIDSHRPCVRPCEAFNA